MSSDRPGGSSAPAIDARSVSKRYLLGEREQYGALRDVLASGFKRKTRGGREELWALRDLSFTVDEGEVLGVIGRNGAGKSTLLKVLSRITSPTEGEIRIRGRIGSLLEVGSGFHPELTGVENVFLNGAILGMSRAEIQRKLDEILAFAEMEQFASTPVKHYSVGMFMRLAFAVAAHLESEILIVDEVLAVGDARFQEKCLSKMGEVARSGRSVLFVSHNLEATVALCDRGILLERGKLLFDGPTADAVEQYRRLAGVSTRSGDEITLDDEKRQGTGEARFQAITINPALRNPASGDTGRPGTDATSSAIGSGAPLVLDLGVDAREAVDISSVGLTFSTEAGLLLLNLDSADGGAAPLRLAPGETTLRVTIPSLRLAPGRYRLGLRLANPVTTRLGSGAIDLLDPAVVLQLDEQADRPSGSDADSDHTVLKPCTTGAGPLITQGAGSVVQGEMTLQLLDR
ncbi:MAG: ABC transporter ATP-binding protein [Actinomycetota bacterium]